MSEAQFGLTGATTTEAPVVTATGDIDLANVNEFHDALTKAANGAPALTVDLARVSYCDSSAVRALFSVAAITKLSLVVGSSGPIKTLLSVSGLDRVASVITADE
jgi:anti-sigma B factor antagonist